MCHGCVVGNRVFPRVAIGRLRLQVTFCPDSKVLGCLTRFFGPLHADGTASVQHQHLPDILGVISLYGVDFLLLPHVFAHHSAGVQQNAKEQGHFQRDYVLARPR